MARLIQSPTDPDFVQNPYPFYARARAEGPLHEWQDYGMMAAFTHDAVQALLKDRRFGREVPVELAPAIPDHLTPFYDIEAHLWRNVWSPASILRHDVGSQVARDLSRPQNSSSEPHSQ